MERAKEDVKVGDAVGKWVGLRLGCFSVREWFSARNLDYLIRQHL